MDLNEIYNTLSNVKANPAISVFVKTHRTFPDNEQDPIALKNAISDLEKQLLEKWSKREVEPIIEKIQQELHDHNHNYNLDTLAIFATADEARVYRFPFETVDRIIIDEHFAVRELLREINSSLRYYIVTVSRTYGRMIEVYNDHVLHEFNESDEIQGYAFPLENTTLYNTQSGDRANGISEDNYLKEFANRVDKSVQEIYRKNPHPVILFADKGLIGIYQQVADNPKIIAGTVTNSANLEGPAADLVKEAKAAIDAYQIETQQQHIEEISKARGQNQLLQDLTDIHRATNEGRIQTLFVRKGYVQAAKIAEDTQAVAPLEQHDTEATTQDIVNDIIASVVQHGGQVKFISPDHYQEKLGIVAQTRY